MRNPARCVFVQYTAEYGGSPISGFAVVDALKKWGFEVDVVLGVLGPLEDGYRDRGCRVYFLPHGQWLVGGSRIRRLRRWGRELSATWKFVQLLKRLQPQLVYVNTLPSVSAVMAARVRRVPVIWHIREQLQDAGGEMHIPFGGKIALQKVVRWLPNKVVCISESVQRNILGARYCSKSSVIYNPLANEYFKNHQAPLEARRRLGLPESGFIVGLPGTMRAVKGHEYFLRAAAALLDEGVSCDFAISGNFESEYGRKVRDYAKSLGIDKMVYFVGEVNDMRTFYQACTIVCVPSRGEPYGRTVIEAFAQGCPVIATKVGGIMESVEDGRTGLLVEYGDVSALRDAIRDLYLDSSARRRLAENARESVLQRNNVSTFEGKLNKVLESLFVHRRMDC